MKTVARLTLLISFAASSGCANSLMSSLAIEQQVIEQFADALAEENEPALKRIASTKFEQTAERSGDILNDLRALKLPKSAVTVVEVNEIDETHREVIVKEESGGKYQFHLVHDPAKNYWTVDDVVVRQRSRGTRSAKSTTEVVELLITLREFLKVWESGERDQILAMTSPRLTDSLSPLPDGWLPSLTRRIASNYEKGMARKPEANLGDDSAVVKLPAKNGHLLLSLVRNENGWQVDDVEAQNHREDHHPGSVRRQADAINAVNAFLTAYGAEDRETLQKIVSSEFYKGSLKVADLTLIELPSAQKAPEEFDIRAYENKLTFMIPFGREIVRVDLAERDDDDEAADMLSRFEVQDVTLYERSTQKQRALSSLFTAPTRASIFLKALATGDEDVLLELSTPDFSRGTWARGPKEHVQHLHRPDFHTGGLKLVDSHTMGNLTELEFETAQGLVVHCQMLNQNGQLRVDDVQYPNSDGEVTSLKTQLELSVPLVEFANAWEARDMTLVQKASSSDFNRLVWSHLSTIPARFGNTPRALKSAPVKTRVTPERATVTCQIDQIIVEASLVLERDYWVVDEVKVPAGNRIVGIRGSLREEIADKILTGSYSTRQLADGRQVVAPFKRQDAFEQNLGQIAKAETLPAPKPQGHIQQVSGQVQSTQQLIPGQVKSNSVQQAVFTQKYDAAGQPQTKNPFQLATQQQANQPLKSASVRPEGVASESRGGMAVFGPNASAVRRQLTEPKPAMKDLPPGARREHALDLTQPISTKPDTNATEAAAVKSKADGLMYFGPGKDQLASGKPKANIRQLAQPKLTQPADMPISVK